MALKLSERVIECLAANPDKRFTAREIAEWVLEKYPKECQAKMQRSDYLNDNDGLLRQITAEVGASRPRIQKEESKIKTAEERPMKYYYTEVSDDDEVKLAEADGSIEAGSDKPRTKEYDLYPILSKFLLSELNVYSKRIDEKKRSGRNKGSKVNEWLYPDLVGIADLSQGWHREIKDCAKEHNLNNKAKLWSFEVKILINSSNVRSAIFQTISNSSWANFSYLVASEVQGDFASKELRMLASVHGIGFIKLDTENPSESQIMIPAKESPEIDWNTANRLAEESKDFLKYIKSVRKFYQTSEVSQSDWDAKPTTDD